MYSDTKQECSNFIPLYIYTPLFTCSTLKTGSTSPTCTIFCLLHHESIFPLSTHKKDTVYQSPRIKYKKAKPCHFRQFHILEIYIHLQQPATGEKITFVCSLRQYFLESRTGPTSGQMSYHLPQQMVARFSP